LYYDARIQEHQAIYYHLGFKI